MCTNKDDIPQQHFPSSFFSFRKCISYYAMPCQGNGNYDGMKISKKLACFMISFRRNSLIPFNDDDA